MAVRGEGRGGEVVRAEPQRMEERRKRKNVRKERRRKGKKEEGKEKRVRGPTRSKPSETGQFSLVRIDLTGFEPPTKMNH